MYSNDGYQALRETSAVVQRGDRGVIAVSGGDRLAWLQGLLTNDVAALGEGASCYAAYLTPQGRMITDMRVLQQHDRTLLEVPAVLSEALSAKLDSLLFTEDAQVQDVSTTLRAIDVIGPASGGVVQRAKAGGLAVDGEFPDDAYGVPRVSLFVMANECAAAVRALTTAGALEASLETLDVLRIEAGVPLFLVDMDEHTIPLEAGLEDRAISFSKGCYVGQEVIVRVVQRGQGRVAKRLVGLLLPKETPAHAGDVIASGEREIGRVTSASWSPALGRHVALGYVHRDFVPPGTGLLVRASPEPAAATVASLPFVNPPSSR